MRPSPVLALVAVLAAAGCSAGGVNPAKLIEPKVSVRTIAVRNVGLAGGTLEVAFAFHNPNRFSLTGAGLTAALAIEGKKFGDVVLTSPFTLAGTDTTVVTVPLNFSWSGVGGAARSVLNSGAVNYGVDGSFTVKLPANAGDLAVPFTGSGMIPLLKP
ncbi:MAG: LEA type 2 family protein [Gemmatimonadetes bacterium]|nr:LEA type 2 family protein [Gemmatimonadota bacterium]